MRLSVFVEPRGVKELDAEIRELEKAKEEAIRSEAYEEAGEIKKKQEKKREKIGKLREKWEEEKNSRPLFVDEEEIADVVSGWTKIPVSKLKEEETERLLKLESILHERVVGQEEAVTAVSKAIRRGEWALRIPDGPSAPSYSWDPPASGKQSSARLWPRPCSGQKMP